MTFNKRKKAKVILEFESLAARLSLGFLLDSSHTSII